MSTNLFNPSDERKYPSRWPLFRGKQLFRVIDEQSTTGTEELLSVSHITGITPRSQKNVTMFQSESLVGYKLCKVGDIAANTMWTWQGAIAVSNYAGVISPGYNVYRQKDDFYNPRFLDYLLRERTLVDVYHSLSTGIRPSRLRLYPDVFLTIQFPVPPREEQDQIVRYLDWQLSKIHKLIAAKKFEIRILGEQRAALITTEFSSICAPMVRLSMLTSKIGSGKTPKGGASVYSTEGVLFIRSQNVYPTGVKLEDAYYIDGEIDSGMASTRVKTDDVLLNITGGSIGRSCCYNLNIPANVNQHVCIIRPLRDKLNPKYLSMYINSLYGQNLIWSEQKPGNRQSLTFPQIGGFHIPLISVREQCKFVCRLETKLMQAESAIACIERSVDTLNEIRTRMISDAVTGQIDVRGIEVPEFEYVEETVDDSCGDMEEDCASEDGEV